MLPLIFFWYLNNKRFKKKCFKDFDRIFSGWDSSCPDMELLYEYGWPHFKITFKNKNDLAFARKNHLTTDFENSVKKYCSKDFNVVSGFSYTYLEKNEEDIVTAYENDII